MFTPHVRIARVHPTRHFHSHIFRCRYVDIFDDVLLFDNSDDPLLIARKGGDVLLSDSFADDGALTVLDDDRYNMFMSNADINEDAKSRDEL